MSGAIDQNETVPSAALGSSVGTISFPSGAMATAASLKLPRPSGMPMIVKHGATSSSRWAIAIQIPTSMNQMAFPIVDAAPASWPANDGSPEGPQHIGGQSKRRNSERDGNDQNEHQYAG